MMFKKISSLALALVLTLCLAVPALAAESMVEYSGHNLFEFYPGSSYTSTDLFENFKDVMPGDVLQEEIIVYNDAKCCDYIEVYIQAVPHNRTTNTMSPNVAVEQKDQDLAYMQDFLSQLQLSVDWGDKVIFRGNPSVAGNMSKPLFIGKLERKESSKLVATLTVPIELGNEYAYRVGEVDWQFLIEEYDYDSDVPKTGDHMTQALVPLLAAMVLSGGALLALLIIKRKKKK